MLKFDEIKQLDDTYLIPTYKRTPVLFVQGAGCKLWDNRGNAYLDMVAGIAVNVLGHCHPSVVSAVTRQVQQLIHTSNLYLTAPQAKLAEKLCKISGMEKAWFGNCGATANEMAIKIAKKHGITKRPEGDYEIICLHKSFHGRTMGAISATGQRKYQRSFEPLVPGFIHVTANDATELREKMSHKTAAILVEPVMGEGGVLVLESAYLEEAKRLCDEYDALLIFDEVQCGMGRTGKWFAFQHTSVSPDIMVLAKGLGGGVPIGAVLASGKAAAIMEPGDHGCTFGGNPLSCAAAIAVIDAIHHQKLLDNAARVGQHMIDTLSEWTSVVEVVSGRGLMLGIKLKQPQAREIVSKALEMKLLVNATDESTLRLVPPLILTKDEADSALSILAELLGVTYAPTKSFVKIDRPRPLTDILAIDDLSTDELLTALDLASELKVQRKVAPRLIPQVENRSVALVFEKPSLRTRVSFEAAIQELGGHPVYLSKADIGMGNRESVKDVAGNLSGWVSAIVARLYWHKHLLELAEQATVPVVNALTEMEHPCQAMADLQTIREEFGDQKVKIAYVGDGNNVSRSLAKAATRLGYPVTICGPENFRLEEMPGLAQTSDLEEGLSGAMVVYTDVWISMGDEHEQEHRMKVFEPYQVNAGVMEMANSDAIFLHCLPAHRGYEVTDEVIDSRQSRVYAQAENRMHAQKALLKMLLGW